MNFTREPIIESVISSSDGYKLRLTKFMKVESQDEGFLVDALEVVSFSGTCFYRHREKPKSFLLPVTEYELIQVRDTRLSLKYATVDKSIKIIPENELKKSAGKAVSMKNVNKEVDKEKLAQKRILKNPTRVKTEDKKKGVLEQRKEAQVDPSVISVLSPPSCLISESLKKYKSIDFSAENSFSLLPPPTTLVDTPIIPTDSGSGGEKYPTKENRSVEKLSAVESKPQTKDLTETDEKANITQIKDK